MVDGVGPGVTVFLIGGEILPGDDERFYQMAQAAPTATVALDSPGGSVDTGIEDREDGYFGAGRSFFDHIRMI